MRVFTRGALTACVVVLRAHPATADPSEPIRFTYAAPAECPTEEQFVDAVARDGALLLRAERGTPAADLAVILRRERALVGRLVLHGIDGHEASRTIQGDRCEDVASSLAVLVALSLEPEAPSAPAPRAPPRPRGDTPDPASDPSPDDVLPVERWRLGLSGETTLAGGAGPGLQPGLAVYAELVHDAAGPFAPALRLGVEKNASYGGVRGGEPAVYVNFSRLVGRADLCPFRFTFRQPWARDSFSADLCARLDVGVLDVTGAEAPRPARLRYAWVAAGALLRIRWVLPPMFFDLEAGAVAPFVRERVFVEPDSVLFETPSIAGAGGIGVGGYFL